MANLMRNINTISRCGASFRVKNSSENLPGIYHSYIFAICSHPGWSQDKLAKFLSINKSNITRHFSFLEENGYIERKSGEKDKRELLVYPTQKMLDILPEVTEISHRWNEQLTDGIDQNDLEAFRRVLGQLAENAKQIIYGGENGK